jgi:hypothetical protein
MTIWDSVGELFSQQGLVERWERGDAETYSLYVLCLLGGSTGRVYYVYILVHDVCVCVCVCVYVWP